MIELFPETESIRAAVRDPDGPRVAALQSSQESPPKKTLAPKRVLVVEDNLDSVHSLVLLLQDMGHQVDYAINNRLAADTILPLAKDRGQGVLINLPFGRRSALEKTTNKPVPAWAKDIGCTTWAQIFLKYVVSHSAVTVAIPGTRSLDHLTDNMAAAHGPLPDAAMRKRIETEYDAL